MKKKNLHQIMGVFALILILSITGCSGKEQTAQPVTAPAEPVAYQPVSIQNFDRELTFNEPPKRAVSLNQHTTEIMLALGLQDHMVGTAYMDDQILPDLQAAYQGIPVLADKYPSLEVLLGANPDFVYGRKSAFSEKNLGSVDALAEKGITAYVAQGTYVPVGRIEDVYDDILNVGRIFGVEDQALKLIESMKQEIDQVREQIGSVEKPLRVFAFDSGDQAAFTAGQSLSTQLIEFAGGKNIFDDVAKSWAEVSWEEVVSRDPEVILIYDYDQPSAEEKIQFLKNHSALKNVTAIQHDHFVVLRLSDVFEGVRNATAVQTMAKGFYPDRFK